VNSPAIVQTFFAALIEIASVDFYDCTNFFYENLGLEEVAPLNEWFEFMGYKSPYTIVNFGSAIFIIPTVTVIVLLTKLFSYLELPKKLKSLSYRILEGTIWNFYISFVNEMFLNFSICIMLQYTYFKFDTVGTISNSVVCLIFTAILSLFPIVMTYAYAKNF